MGKRSATHRFSAKLRIKQVIYRVKAMRLTKTLTLLTLFLAGCSQSTNQSLARQGAINQNAPVKADTQIIINAPPNRVWTILTSIQNWPKWQPDITSAAIAQQPAVGVPFEWSTGAGTIHSRIARYEPQQTIAWTGRLLIFHAIHIWTITALPNGETKVETRESMSGWPITWLYSSASLLQADQRWLADLKKQAES